MSELFVFGFGAVVFSMTTWAVIAFGLYRSHELQLEDLAASGRTAETRDDGLTELHVEVTDDAGTATASDN